MMFATGAGANSRIELGTAVVFGMALNAIIGTLFVPNFWELMQTISEKYLKGLFKDPNAGKTGDASAITSTADSLNKEESSDSDTPASV